MTHFAKIEGGKVTQVIVAEQDVIDTLPGTWVQTSYNTRAGKRRGGDENSLVMRGNFAGIGYEYDEILDAFIPEKPYDSWVLDAATYSWKSPTPDIDDNVSRVWDEASKAWVRV